MKRLSPQRGQRVCRVFATGVLALFLIGCGKSEAKFTPVPVSGKVTIGNAALPMGTITFHPDTEKGNTLIRVAQGTIQSDGTYKLAIVNSDGVQLDGAPPGWYKVTVVMTGMSDPAQIKTKIPYIEGKYSDTKYTPLSVEVREGAPAGSYDIKLQR